MPERYVTPVIGRYTCVACRWAFFKVGAPRNGLCSWCQRCPCCYEPRATVGTLIHSGEIHA